MHFGSQAEVGEMKVIGVENTLLGSLPFGGVGGGALVELHFSAPHHQGSDGEVEWGRGRVLLRESIHEELEIEGLVAVLVYLGLRTDELRPAYLYLPLYQRHEIDFRGDSRGLEHQGVSAVVESDVVQYEVPKQVHPQVSDADSALDFVLQKLRRNPCSPLLKGRNGRQNQQGQVYACQQTDEDAEYVFKYADRRPELSFSTCKDTKNK